MLKYIQDRVSKGGGVRKTIKEAAKEFGIGYNTIEKILYKKNYAWSPYFEYDDKGRRVGPKISKTSNKSSLSA